MKRLAIGLSDFKHLIKEDFYLNLENKKKVNNIFINMEGK